MMPLKRELASLPRAFLMSAGRLNVSSGVSLGPLFLINQQRLIPVCIPALSRSLAPHLTAATSSFARWIVRNVLRAETFLFVLLLSLSYTFHRHRSRTLTVPLSRVYPSFCVSRCEFALRYVSFFPSEIAVSFPKSSRIRDRNLKVNEKKKDVEECRHVGRRSYFAQNVKNSVFRVYAHIYTYRYVCNDKSIISKYQNILWSNIKYLSIISFQ